MSALDNLNSCNSGEKFYKKQSVCNSCGRKRYRMSVDGIKEDSVDLYEKNIRRAIKITKDIFAFQLLRTRTGQP